MTDTTERTGTDTIYDVATLLMLLLGGFAVPVLGWVAAVVMAWNLPRWTVGQKWLATLIWPLALAVPLTVVLVSSGLTGAEHNPAALLAALAVAAIAVPAATIHLGIAAARGRRAGHAQA